MALMKTSVIQTVVTTANPVKRTMALLRSARIADLAAGRTRSFLLLLRMPTREATVIIIIITTTGAIETIETEITPDIRKTHTTTGPILATHTRRFSLLTSLNILA